MYFRTNSIKSNKPLVDLSNLSPYEDQEDSKKIIFKLREKFSKIRSLSAEDISVSFKRFSTKGQLYYEDNNLRLIISSFLGKEIDIGSNKELFWFWSRRMKPRALYYSNHKDVYNTNLRPIFNRDWVLDCFIFNRFENSNDLIFFKNNNIFIIKSIKKTSNQDFVYIVTLVDINNLNILSRYICDLEDTVMASVEYYNFDENSIPKLIKVFWYEENINMQWKLENISINKDIDDIFWELPKDQPAVNMSEVSN